MTGVLRGQPFLRHALLRTAAAGMTFVGAMVLLFALTRSIPGDPITIMLGPRATPELRAEYAARMGLDLPLWRQLSDFIGRAVTGDFGNSLRFSEPVTSNVRAARPVAIQASLVSADSLKPKKTAKPVSKPTSKPANKKTDPPPKPKPKAQKPAPKPEVKTASAPTAESSKSKPSTEEQTKELAEQARYDFVVEKLVELIGDGHQLVGTLFRLG